MTANNPQTNGTASHPHGRVKLHVVAATHVDFHDEPQQAEEQAHHPEGLSTTQIVGIAALLLAAITLPLVCRRRLWLVDLWALMCFVPAGLVCAYAGSRSARRVTPFSTAFGKFAFGFLALYPTVLVGCVFAFGIVMLLLSSVLPAEFRMSQALFVVLTIASCVAVVSVEEVCKMLVVSRRNTVANPRQFVLFAVYYALGLGTAGSYFAAVLLIAVFHPAIDDTGGMMYAPAFADLLFLRIVVSCSLSIPATMLASYHVGLGIARRAVLNHRIRAPAILFAPILFRSTFSATLILLPWLLLPTFEESFQTTPTSSLAGSITLVVLGVEVVCYVLWVLRYEKNMPREYLLRAGYLNAVGFGAVGGDPEATNQEPIPVIGTVVDSESLASKAITNV